MSSPRKLVAILAADVVSYSRLTGLDEEGTLTRLRNIHNDLINPTVALHRGRIVKTTGDGLLVEFPSVVDAVRCALEVQRGMEDRKASVPAEQQIEFRIGINLGDVVVEGDDLLGDDVNVAARLEGIAEPGGICISDVCYQRVRAKVSAEFVDLGEQKLKNIALPVRVYRLKPTAKSALRQPRLPAQQQTGEDARGLPEKPSIAVLSFQNLSGDPEQDYVGRGLAEDVLTELSKLRWLFVAARNSSLTFKGGELEVKQVYQELEVRYVLTGSVRRASGQIRIAAQLIDVPTGIHIWAERYDRDFVDIFAVQDEITKAVAAAIGPAIVEAERQRAVRKPPENLGAWEAYQRGLWHIAKHETAENEVARGLFQVRASVRRLQAEPAECQTPYSCAQGHKPRLDSWRLAPAGPNASCIPRCLQGSAHKAGRQLPDPIFPRRSLVVRRFPPVSCPMDCPGPTSGKQRHHTR
jgi:adenylate cyclase